MRIVFTLFLFVATACSASEIESRYFASVFSGDLSWVAGTEATNTTDLALKSRFDERFLLRVDSVELADVEDPLVAAIARRYEDYWREALIAPAGIENAEQRLAGDLSRLIELDGVEADPDNLDSALSELLARRGFRHRGGRTPPLLDFMLWRGTRTTTHVVELTDSQQEVVVHYLDDFIMRGWSHFATFGRSSTGGWADRDALYCITEAYDLESEDFKNSYLRHEARHFADYERYPKLRGVDLEYRAKLTELAFATDAMRLLRKFQRHANEASEAPHPLANWHVVQNMASHVSSPCNGEALRCLETASNQHLQTLARRLLDDHSGKLESLGPGSVASALEPGMSD